MTNEVIVFPDAAAALILYLQDRFIEHAENATVHSQPPADRPDRFVTIRRGGGIRSDLVIDTPTLLVEAWGLDDDDAHDLAQLARGFLHAAAGTTQHGVTFHRVGEFGGPANLPDPDSQQARVVFTLTAGVRGSAL